MFYLCFSYTVTISPLLYDCLNFVYFHIAEAFVFPCVFPARSSFSICQSSFVVSFYCCSFPFVFARHEDADHTICLPLICQFILAKMVQRCSLLWILVSAPCKCGRVQYNLAIYKFTSENYDYILLLRDLLLYVPISSVCVHYRIHSW